MAVVSSNLQTIQQKVRRLTRSPSEAQLTDAQLNQYINTFVLYDFPEQIRTFNLLTTFTFFTNIGQDAYPTNTISFAGAINNPLYDFQNKYISIEPPVYIAGFQSPYFQSREQFYGIYPFVNNISSIGVAGNGTSGPFTGFINTQFAIINPGTFQQRASLLQENVLFSATGTPGTNEVVSLSLADVPIVDPTTGLKLNIGNLYDPNTQAYADALITPPTTLVDPNNFINYITGQYSINFSAPTVVNTPINSQTALQLQSLPQALLFYDDTFFVRPIPDQSYEVNFQAYIRPTELLNANQNPDLNEWWQYIAFQTAKKIFEDKMDMDSVAMIMPALKEQERLCLRRSIVQQTNQRTSTIYSDQFGGAGQYGSGWWSGGLM